MNASNKKWKDGLLKTSLPLEYVVARELNDMGFGIQGEFHYLRPDESGITKEFSIDIWAVTHLLKKDRKIWGELNYLIECKYCYPGITWIFALHERSDTEYLMEGGPVYTLDKLCTRQIFNKKPIWNLPKTFPLCSKGVELHEGGATEQNIERGRSQLRYGAPRLAAHLSEGQMLTFNDEDLHPQFICPVLVTTAELYVLKKGLALNKFVDAKEVPEIASKVGAVLLTNPHSHLFVDYADKIIGVLHQKFPDIKDRLEKIDGLLKRITGDDKGHPSAWAKLSFNFDIREISRRILVINLEEMKSVIKILRKTVVRTANSLTQIGILQKDISQMKTWISECDESDL